VELIVPVEDPALQGQLIANLHEALADNRLAWDLHPDGRYVLRWPGRAEEVRNFQQAMMAQAAERAKI
jgi:polyphosphate kinase